MSDFDRIRPPGRRTETPGRAPLGTPGADPAGRGALFSRPAQEPVGCTVTCSRCGATSPLGLRTAVQAAFPLFLVAPWRRHPIFAVCPACRRRAWLRPAVAAARR